jgi:CBS domain-containing protein
MDQTKQSGTPCTRNVVRVAADATVAEAAVLMREHHVGAVVVVDPKNDERPIGIITDRDIVVEVVAAGLTPEALLVSEIIQRPIVTIRDGATFTDVVREMSINGVRRLPVVDEEQALVGIASLDDMLEDLAGALVAAADLATRGRRVEFNTRP